MALTLVCCLLFAVTARAQTPVTPPTKGTDVARATPVPDIPPVKTKDGSIPIVQHTDDDLLLLELRLNDLVLVDAMQAYLSGSSIVLPLRDFTSVLDFSIGVDPTSGTASGWFLSPNRLFSLNVPRGEVVIDGVAHRFDKRLVELHEDDIYVDIRLLARWFPVDLAFDLSNLMVKVTSREPLPVEQRLARKEYRQRALTDRSENKKDLPRIETPYQAVSVPEVDVNASTTLDRDSNGDTTVSTRHNMTMTGDLAWANANLFVGGDNKNKADDVRLKLSRSDPNGAAFSDVPGLAGLDITHAAVGDIYSPQLSLISRTELGRGFTVSNMPLDAPSEFDRITLTGDLPLGWEAELYRNEILINYQASRNDGQYVFEDVPLVYGVNVLRVVLYGPQGQVKEKIRQFSVGPGQTKAGELDLRFTANQHDRPLLVRDENADKNLEGTGRMFAEAQYGVSKSLTIGSNLAQLPTSEGTQRYATASANFTLGDVFGRYDAIRQLSEGWAQRVSLQTSEFGLTLLGEHAAYNNFFSEQVSQSSDPLVSQSRIRVDGAVPKKLASFLPRIPFSLSLNHDRHESGDASTSLDNRMSAAVGAASLTNTLNYRLDQAADDDSSTLSGSALVGGRIDNFKVRGSVGYDVVPVKSISSVGLSGDWRIDRDWHGSAGILRNLNNTVSTTYTLGVNAQLSTVAVGFNVDYSDADQLTSMMTVSFGLGYDNDTGNITMQANGIANGGALSALVFLDSNANGVFDKGEEPIKGARLTVDGGRHSAGTGDNGKVFVTNLPANREAAITIDRGSLTDPYWVSTKDGYTIVSRSGNVASAVFPVVSTGEIDGTAFRAWKDGTGEAAGVVVQLVDRSGKVVRSQKSAYDGFFLFDFVRPGKYTLRVDPKQLALLGLTADKTYSIEILGDGTIVSGQDIVLSTPALAQLQEMQNGWGAKASRGEKSGL